MPWTRSLLGSLIAPYLIGLAAFATALYVSGRIWVAAAVAVLATLYPTWLLARRLFRLTELSSAIAEGAVSASAPDRDDAVGRLEANLIAVATTLRSQLQAAHEEKEKLEAVLSGMVEGVLVLDREGEIRLSNRCAERLFGSTADESLVGRPLMNVSRDPDLQELVREVMRDDVPKPSRREITFEGPSGESLQVSATAIGTPDSAPLYILVFHDITELKKLEATRRDFVANVSHELRTPLTAIRGYAETLQSGALSDVGVSQRFVEVIARHSERLSRLIDDLLTLSDLELGRTEIQLAPMSLDGAVAAAMEVVRDKAEQGRVRLQHEVASDTPMVLADPDRIEQLLVNLVDNAVKYTPEGGSVTVRAEANAGPNGGESPPGEAANADSKWVELKILDTGIGIPKSELPRLTERFYRVDKARSRALGGTGLGLAIVKHIVQAHGGSLKIDSDFGKGTCVFVYLKAAPSE